MALRGLFSVSGSVAAPALGGKRGELCVHSWKSALEAGRGCAVNVPHWRCQLVKSVTIGQNTNVPKDDPSASEEVYKNRMALKVTGR